MTEDGRFVWGDSPLALSEPAVVCVKTPLGWWGVAGVTMSPGQRWCAFGVTIGYGSRLACREALQSIVRTTCGAAGRRTRADAAAGCAALCERLRRFACGEAVDSFEDVWVWAPAAGTFRRRVLERVRAIPPGSVHTYGQIAAAVGAPKAARAVGAVMRSNRVPIVVPCHRVVGAGGRLTGFTAPAGVELKRRLLALERRRAANGSGGADAQAAAAALEALR